jgi:hypothetical protein
MSFEDWVKNGWLDTWHQSRRSAPSAGSLQLRDRQSIPSSQQGQMSNSYRSLRHRNQRSLSEISLANFENAC